MTLREKVARAMCANANDGRDVWTADGIGMRSAWLASADAALAVVREAMREPSAEMLDRSVSFALNVKISGEYGWSAYMRDLWSHQLAASPLAENPDD